MILWQEYSPEHSSGQQKGHNLPEITTAKVFVPTSRRVEEIFNHCRKENVACIYEFQKESWQKLQTRAGFTLVPRRITE